MRVHSIAAKNYGPFAELKEVRLGTFVAIIGQNDSGKSHILRALQTFFDIKKLEIEDVHNGARADESALIEVSFTNFPETIELEDSVQTKFQDELLLDKNGFIRIRKTYPCSEPSKYKISFIVEDFSDDSFANLCVLKEKDINARCQELGLQVSNSGRGITNKSKREAIRGLAAEKGIEKITKEIPVTSKDDLWKKISELFPDFVLFETDTKLGVGETTFQSQFRPIIKNAAEEPAVKVEKDQFEHAIENALQVEINKIFGLLRKHTNAFTGLRVKPEFNWDKAVSFQLIGKDDYDVETSLERRGSGIRRLLMVAFIQYLAERKLAGGKNLILGVEEPENSLHPKLQRELANSFRLLEEKGYQVLLTSHSPVIAGSSPIEDLTLVMRDAGIAQAIQIPELDMSDIAEQLGVEPADQITGYKACVFVEGPADVEFWRAISSEFKKAGLIDNDFDDKKIGFILCGGDTLKYWIDSRAMGRLNRNFAVVIDSDKKAAKDNIPGKKVNWKTKCESDGGLFYILQKREIENYIHPAALKRAGLEAQAYDDFSDMKSLFGEKVYKHVKSMSIDEIKEMDKYDCDGTEKHEIEEIVHALLNLPEQSAEKSI